MEGKVCSKCGEWKVYGEFAKRKAMKDGHRSECKECNKKYRKDNEEYFKQYRKDNSEKNKEYLKVYWKDNHEELVEKQRQKWNKNSKKYNEKKKQYRKENPELIKEQKKISHIKHKEANNERMREYYKKNKDKIRLYIMDWQRNNPDRISNYRTNTNFKRRSKEFKVDFKPFERKELLERDNWTCKCCGIKVHDRSTGNWNTPDKAHIDHIIPISKGGNSEPSNLQILCRTCNLTKSDKLVLQLNN